MPTIAGPLNPRNILVLIIGFLLYGEKPGIAQEQPIHKDEAAKLLRMQNPDFAQEHPFLIVPIAKKGRLIVCRSADSKRSYNLCVFFNKKGMITGPPLRVPLSVNFGESYAGRHSWDNDTYLDIDFKHVCFKVTFHEEGIVPLGFFIHGTHISKALSSNVRQWLKEVGDAPAVDLQALLPSKSTAAIHRGLFQLTFSKDVDTAKVIPFLSHSSPDIRAHAIAILAHDTEQHCRIIPLCENPSLKVRHAAYAALLGSPDKRWVKRSFNYFLRQKKGGFLNYVNCNPKRRLIKENVKYILLQIIENWNYWNDSGPWGLFTLINSLKWKTLAPHLLDLWHNNQRLQGSLTLTKAWLRRLLRYDTPDIRAMILLWIKAQKPIKNLPFSTFLLMLAEDSHPHPTAVPLLMDIADENQNPRLYIKNSTIDADFQPLDATIDTSSRQLATLVLLRWKVENALDLLVEIMETEMYPETFCIKGWGELWCKALTIQQKRMLIQKAMDRNPMLIEPLAYLLCWSSILEAKALKDDYLKLWHLVQPGDGSHFSLTGFLVRLENQAVDDVILSCLKNDYDHQVANVLNNLLRWRSRKPIAKATDDLKKLARKRRVLDTYINNYRRDRIDGFHNKNIALPTPSEHTIDIQLAAALLLVHWKVPDAEKHLFHVLYQEGGDCLFDHLWDMAPPRHISAALEAVTKDYPDIYKRRVAQIMAPQRP